MATPNNAPELAETWRHLYRSSEEHWNDLRRMGRILLPILFLAVMALLYTISFLSLHSQEWITDPSSLPATTWWFFRIGIIFLSPLLALIACLALLFRGTSHFIGKFYQPSEKTKIKALVLRRMLGVPPLPPPLNMVWKYPLMPFKEPKLEEDAWIRWLGGPATLVIYDGTALYLERGNRFSRVVGPGSPPMPFLERYETVREVVDLRPQVKTGFIRGWTKDGIPVEMEVRMECQIDASAAAREKSANLVFPFDPVAVQLAVEHMAVKYDSEKRNLVESDWVDGMWGQVSSFFLGYLISRSLDELFLSESGREQIFAPRISQEGVDKLNDNLAKINLGAHIVSLQITTVKVPPSVDEQRIAFWESERKKLANISDSIAHAGRIRIREQARADVLREMLNTITNRLKDVGKDNMTEPILLSLIGILDQSLEDPIVRPMIAKESLSMLERIRQMLKDRF